MLCWSTGPEQTEQVSAMQALTGGLEDVRRQKDMFDVERFVTAFKK